MKYRFFNKLAMSGLALMALVSSGMAATLPKYDILDYVPADTAFFYGQFMPKPSGAQLAMVQQMGADMYASIFEEAIKKSEDPQDKFIMNVASQIFKELSTSFESTERDLISSVAYTVDLMPVYKFEMDDASKIWEILAKAEQDSGMKADISYRQNVEYWTYNIKLDEQTNLKLVVAVHGNWVVITTDAPSQPNSHFDIAFGISKPQKSINQTDILQDIADKYNFNGQQIFYVDIVKIVNTFTGYIENELMTNWFGEGAKDMVSLACQQDIAGLVAMWPRTVWGTTFVESTEHTYLDDSKLIFEITNASTIQSLLNLRGHLPQRDNGMKAMFSMALGLNMDNLTSSVTQLWRAAVNAEFGCDRFIKLQDRLRELNPALLNMATGMARGVNGIGFAVFDMDIVEWNGDTKVENIDGLVTLSAQDPLTQFLSLTLIDSGLSRLKLRDDGSEIDVTAFIPDDAAIKGDVKVAINGKHLNMYQGEKARKAARLLTPDEIEPNGILGFSINYGMVLDLVKIQLTGNKVDIPFDMKFLFDVEMEMSTTVDFSKNGIELLTQTRFAQ